jgi:hypothetical protein
MNVIDVTAENRDRVRRYYLSLCDQGRANFLYDNNIGGASLMLSPNQYPETPPMHRNCKCGAEPEIIFHSIGDCQIICPRCGCKSVRASTPMWTWKSWDHEVFETDMENLTIWEVM